MKSLCFAMMACVLLEFVSVDVAWGQDAAETPVVPSSRASQVVEGKLNKDDEQDGNSNRLISPESERSLNRSKFDSLKPFMVTPKAEPESSVGKVWREFKEFVVSIGNWLTNGHNLYWSVCAILVIGYLVNRMRR